MHLEPEAAQRLADPRRAAKRSQADRTGSCATTLWISGTSVRFEPMYLIKTQQR